MHGVEKSDPPVVAANPANKAAVAAAEPGDRRGGTGENADPQSTVRTQSRAAVSQARARIRVAHRLCRPTGDETCGSIAGRRWHRGRSSSWCARARIRVGPGAPRAPQTAKAASGPERASYTESG